MTTSNDPAVPGLEGENDAGGVGVLGTSATGRGMVGSSDTGVGVDASSGSNSAVVGTSKTGRGVEGYADVNYGVYGQSRTFPGVRGTSVDGRGMEGWSTSNSGLWGLSETGYGVEGSSKTGDGVVGTGRRGVVGISPTYQGVYGTSTDNAGVVGESQKFHAVFGISHDPNNAGIFGTNVGGGFAGVFDGRVWVTGDLTVAGDVVLPGADVAEYFPPGPADQDVSAGSVVVLDDHGRVSACAAPYDSRVAGVVSGAGDRVPALILDRSADPAANAARLPIAVAGKAWCRADATTGPIGVGDLLTTSAREGHAMRAADRLAALGAIIGKALTPLASGTGLVLVLVALS